MFYVETVAAKKMVLLCRNAAKIDWSKHMTKAVFIGLYDILGGITSPWGRTPWVVPLKWRRWPWLRACGDASYWLKHLSTPFRWKSA